MKWPMSGPSREPFVRVVWVIGCMCCGNICLDLCFIWMPSPITVIPFSAMCLFAWLAKIAWED
jgi:hypothetical protein